MSNFKRVEPLPRGAMATSDVPPVGIDHPTVVPTNFDPTETERPDREPGER